MLVNGKLQMRDLSSILLFGSQFGVYAGSFVGYQGLWLWPNIRKVLPPVILPQGDLPTSYGVLELPGTPTILVQGERFPKEFDSKLWESSIQTLQTQFPGGDFPIIVPKEILRVDPPEGISYYRV
jgi:hypothetical protein